METGAQEEEEMDTRQLYIYLCINICPVLTQHGRGVAMNAKS